MMEKEGVQVWLLGHGKCRDITFRYKWALQPKSWEPRDGDIKHCMHGLRN